MTSLHIYCIIKIYKYPFYGDLADINPIRYRGYVYDFETGFYYLNSRYYDPQVKRFINADDANLLGANGDFSSLNLYSYCGNSPVFRADDGGEFWHILAGAAVGGVSSFVASVATQLVESKGKLSEVNWDTALVSAGFGMITGAAVAACPTLVPVISGLASATESVVTDVYFSNEKLKVGEIASNAIVSGTFGAITGSWGNDFANNTLIDDAVHSLKDVLFTGVNPAVKKASLKVVKRFNKFMIKTTVSSVLETTGLAFVGEGIDELVNLVN